MTFEQRPIVRVLADHGLVVSFAEARRLIGQNCVKVNNKVVGLDASVEPGDSVQILNREAIRIGR